MSLCERDREAEVDVAAAGVQGLGLWCQQRWKQTSHNDQVLGPDASDQVNEAGRLSL